MKQRSASPGAVPDPDVIFLDEPTDGVDPIAAATSAPCCWS